MIFPATTAATLTLANTIGVTKAVTFMTLQYFLDGELTLNCVCPLQHDPVRLRWQILLHHFRLAETSRVTNGIYNIVMLI